MSGRRGTRQLPSRFRRLDGALADLPIEEPMLLSELDGFLTGLLVGPEPIAPAEWMTVIWGPDDPEVPPFEDPIDVQWFADAVRARHDEIARDLARGKLKPIFDSDERGELLWEYWLDGFAEAMALRPDAWAAMADGGVDTASALDRLSMLIAVANEESTLDSIEINALQDRAAGDLVEAVQCLYGARGVPIAAAPTQTKIGRNDPCACGSGKKSKRCCG